MDRQRIDVCFITDETYVRPTRVALESLKANKSTETEYRVHVICRGVSEEGVGYIVGAADEGKGVYVEALARDSLPVDEATVSLVRHVSPTAIFKFFLPEVFPELDKLLYLDSDILVLDDLSDLWRRDVSNVYAGVVCDNQTVVGRNAHLKWLSFRPERYFNSGVMLLNLAGMRRDGVTAKLMEYRISGKNRFMDQDALNVVFDGRVEYLPLRYNCLNWLFITCTLEQLRELFGPDQVGATAEETMDKAAVLHMGGSEKPWLCDCPYYTPLYLRYASMAGWKIEYPKVSVVIPVYNSERHLRETLFSVCAQTLKELDIICVDNGSRDSSASILAEFAARDPRVRILKQPSKGAGTCRNFGVSHARGEFVGFVDSDDFVDLDFFAKLYEKARQTGDDVVMTAHVAECDAFGRTLRSKDMGHQGKCLLKSARDKGNVLLATGVAWNKIYRRRFLLDNHIHFSEGQCAGEDKLFDFGALMSANEVAVVKDTCYHYRQGNENSEAFRTKGRESFAVIDFYREIKRLVDAYEGGENSRSRWKSVMRRVRDKEFGIFAKRMNPALRGDFIGLCAESFYDDCSSSRKIQNLVVSLTSFPPRIKTVHRTIRTIVGQSVRPERILLWLAESQFPNKSADLPEELVDLRRYGLEIKWCDDLRSYKKLIPTLKLYPGKTIVTADDDVLYPRFWLEKLWQTHLEQPECVIVHRARVILLDSRGVRPYREWPVLTNAVKPGRYHVLPTGVGGVLYPPGCFTGEVLRDDVFMRIAPCADDIWFWAMATLNGRDVRQVYAYEGVLPLIVGSQDVSLSATNVQGGENDPQMHAVLKCYPRLFRLLRSEARGGGLARVPLFRICSPLMTLAPYYAVKKSLQRRTGFAIDVPARYYGTVWQTVVHIAKFVMPYWMVRVCECLAIGLSQLVPGKRSRLLREMRLVGASELFDTEWYLSTYRDVARAKMNPLAHFCRNGWRERRNPCPFFDTAGYLAKYPEVARLNVNPLVHFLRNRYSSGKFRPIPVRGAVRPQLLASLLLRSGLFDPEWYAAYACIEPKDAVLHYLSFGSKHHFPPSREFDAPHYLLAHPDVAEHGMDALVHYLLYGRFEGRIYQPLEITKPPHFFVVVAARNKAHCICETIDSVLRQAYRHFEVIVVDCASDDGTRAVIEDRYPAETASGRIRILTVETQDPDKARNAARLHAAGHRICNLECGTEMPENMLEELAFSQTP